MESIPQYTFYRTKYGDELLIDVVDLNFVKNYIPEHQTHILSYYDITLITEGHGTFKIDNKKYMVSPNNMVFSTPGEIRSWDKGSIKNGYALIFEEEFLLSFFNDPYFLQNIAFFNRGRTKAVMTLKANFAVQIKSLILNIKTEINQYKTKDKHILRALLYEALMLLHRQYKQTTQNTDILANTPNRHVSAFVKLVDSEFEQHRDTTYYANKLCITTNYLNQLVNQTIGSNAKLYIQNKVLSESKRLLSYSTLSVSEIADKLNFSSISYFIRFFHSQTQSTPLQYRNNSK